MPSIDSYRTQFRDLHGREAPPLMTADFCLCLPDADEAADKTRTYMGTYLGSLLEHYEVMGDHFAVTAGWTSFRYGGIPYEEATASMQLFTSEILPVTQSWDCPR